ncbi:MAG: acetolactate synthase large subunit [Proteobacteria bacterium]|jgi:acetolactate synthase-1/2/3 large subunit|nr:acetolactate synthase large subunit [Desulfocapsa sp.]MBU3944597.1 acetolactate synthase large subunit [Pseudomonadota bacterium]MCG2744561.1 acetolactate synthase large subunit [Desulfobacteraceae bacterium]MBU3983427.1 acetolactate synthase large subunit [Pseudomonadota bacterium]MBU4027640.1 acetolactate synthase large subunit [Pseudomonadota bacterium]
MNGAELLVRCLENEGVDTIFGIPGEENLAFLEALRKSSIRLILTRHEQAAGFMAATYGRLTGRPGVCLSTLGPGATNLVTAVSYALLGGMPALFITGQKPIKMSKQGRFQILDVVRMMGPLTKFTKQIVTAGSIAPLVRDTFRLATEEKPGPVHLELPEDIAAEETDKQPLSLTRLYPPLANPGSIAIAAELIKQARYPLFLFGAEAKRPDVCRVARGLIEKAGIYFFTTQMGKGIIDEYSPYSLGTAALSDHDYLHCAIERADVIINVGHDVVEKPPFFMSQRDVQVIHVNYSPADIDEVYFPQHEVIGDIGTTLSQLSHLIYDPAVSDNDYFQRIHEEINTHVYYTPSDDQFPDTPQRIVSDIQNTVADNSILSLDNGMYKIWFARNFKATQPDSLLLDNALASMGAGLPVAIAVKLLYPERQVVAVCGDGGFMMNSQEMETAIRLKLDLVVIVLRDNGYGMIKWKQGGMNLPDFGLDFLNPDFIQYAKSYGAKGYRVTRAGELVELLSGCLKQSGLHLIEVPVDYSQNEKVFFQELRNKTCLL